MKRKIYTMPVTIRAAIAAVIAASLMTAGCTLDSFSITGYNNDTCTVDNLVYQVSTTGSRAFATDWYWDLDPENTDIYIPDTIDVSVSGKNRKADVISLGGYMGTGVPCPFMIMPAQDMNYYYATDLSTSEFGTEVTWEDLTFTVHIGKNVSEVALANGSGYCGLRDEDGIIRLYHPVCYFECDPENESLYSRDGILYNRADNTEVTRALNMQHSLPSGPVYSELPLSERIRGRFLYQTDDSEYAVVEIFSLSAVKGVPGNDAFYANVGYYTEDSLYVYSAAVITPLPDDPEADVPDDADTGEIRFTAGIQQFSSFSNDGEYWNEEPDIYAVSVSEENIVFTPVELQGEGFLGKGNEVLTLTRDSSLPSLFPAEINLSRTDPESGDPDAAENTVVSISTARPYYLWGSPFSTGPAVVYMLDDDVLTVIVKDTEVPEIYRGVCAFINTREMVFSLTRLGYGTMPYTGTVYGNVFNKTLSVFQDTADDSETAEEIPNAFPLIPEGETTVTAEPLT